VTAALAALAHGAQQILGRPLSEAEAALFAKYLNLLSKWQRSQRLVGSSAPGWIVENLFLDSLLFMRVLPFRPRSLLDLGSGAGLPGVPMKIVMPDVDLVLVEARQRRASFLSSVVRELGLTATRVMRGRAEDLLPELEGHSDAVVMRCAGNPSAIFPLAARLVAPGGVVIASGPPRPKEAPSPGRWVEVRILGTGRTRWFAVYHLA